MYSTRFTIAVFTGKYLPLFAFMKNNVIEDTYLSSIRVLNFES